MVVRVVLPAEVVKRVDALVPLAARSSVVRRLVELGLEQVQRQPEALCPPPVNGAKA